MSHPRRDRHAGSAARPTGDLRFVHRVQHGAERRILRRGPHGEFIHVGLPDQDGVRGPEPGDRGGVVERDKILEHLRAAGRPLPLHAEDILDRNDHACERSPIPGRKLAVHRPCLLHRLVLEHAQECVKPLSRCDCVEEIARDPLNGRCAALKGAARGIECRPVGHQPGTASRPARAGTRTGSPERKLPIMEANSFCPCV